MPIVQLFSFRFSGLNIKERDLLNENHKEKNHIQNNLMYDLMPILTKWVDYLDSASTLTNRPS